MTPSGKRGGGTCGAEIASGAVPSDERLSAPKPALTMAPQPQISWRLRPERKLVTILFADIKGSTELIAGLDPEQADELLMHAIDLMIQAVHRFGGTVNRIAGDGIMAMFGAPVAEEYHALQACHAALAILADMRQQRSNGLASMPVRIGLHSGEAVVRNTVTDTSSHYDALGETVHIAARMEQNAEPDSVLITAETRRLAGEHVEARALGATSIKGLAGPLQVFELLRAFPSAARRPHTRPGGGLTRFVNRVAELELLRGAAATGGIVALVGDAGCGKSRLVQEFIATLEPGEWCVCRGHAMPFGNVGYRIVIDLIHDHFGIMPGDSIETLRQKIIDGTQQLLGETVPEARQALLALCDQTTAEPAWQALEPAERRRRVETAVANLFRAIARRQRLLLVLEDLHWIDGDSGDLLNLLAELARSERILIVATARPDSALEWLQRGHGTICPVEPLNDEMAQELVRSLVLPGPESASLERQLVSRTRGNPLFIEECLSSLADTGALEAEQSSYRLVGAVRDVELPASLRVLLTSRVDRVPALEKDVLQAASVVGHVVPTDLVELIVPTEPERLREALESLHARGFLTPSDGASDGSSFDFRHAMTREAVYSDMLLRNRRDLHARTLAAIEQRYEDRIIEYVESLAEHASRAEAWDKAADYYRRSARKAIFRNSNSEAARFLQQALDALSRCPDSEENRATQVDVRLEMRYPLFKLGRTEEVADHLGRAAPLALQLHDNRRLALLYTYESHVRWLFGETDAALAAARQAMEAAAATGDRALQVRARFQEGLVRMTRAEYPAAIEAIGGVLDYARAKYEAGSYPDAAMAVTAQCYLARIHADTGMFDVAQRHLDGANALAAEIDDAFSWQFVPIAEGYLNLCRGDAAASIPSFERARGTAVAADARLMVPVPTGFLGMAYAAIGRDKEAIERLTDAIADADAMKHRAGQSIRLAALARAYLAEGEVDAAFSNAVAAADMARAQVEPNGEALALRVIGEARLMRDPPNRDAAKGAIAQALHIAKAHGLAPLAEDCRRRLSQL